METEIKMRTRIGFLTAIAVTNSFAVTNAELLTERTMFLNQIVPATKISDSVKKSIVGKWYMFNRRNLNNGVLQNVNIGKNSMQGEAWTIDDEGFGPQQGYSPYSLKWKWVNDSIVNIGIPLDSTGTKALMFIKKANGNLLIGHFYFEPHFSDSICQFKPDIYFPGFESPELLEMTPEFIRQHSKKHRK